ncbi:hypothetical protein C497_13690 [Halalkalicoccus jeotgali B3]|uniref:Uncharacterized protein n=1 Tax=Halalkalicoccus jeotgali (strain DSM 18796 / CECT 7217 / JCM 14584 / KCTC 4019 / B3) TaxID=795797 RepID=L9VDF5_HALJB|nr:hypothetical protein C497_13690 [Halalkalicoccus jeotgali B3]
MCIRDRFRPDDSVGYGEFVRVVGESSYAG